MNNAPTFVQFHSAVSTGMETAELYSSEPVSLGRLRLLLSLFLPQKMGRAKSAAPRYEESAG